MFNYSQSIFMQLRYNKHVCVSQFFINGPSNLCWVKSGKQSNRLHILKKYPAFYLMIYITNIYDRFVSIEVPTTYYLFVVKTDFN